MVMTRLTLLTHCHTVSPSSFDSEFVHFGSLFSKFPFPWSIHEKLSMLISERCQSNQVLPFAHICSKPLVVGLVHHCWGAGYGGVYGGVCGGGCGCGFGGGCSGVIPVISYPPRPMLTGWKDICGCKLRGLMS